MKLQVTGYEAYERTVLLAVLAVLGAQQETAACWVVVASEKMMSKVVN